MGDIGVANAELIGLWLQLLATGAYLVYFSRCVASFKYSIRGRSSYGWVPIVTVCILMFLCTIGDQVLALVRTYQAFGVPLGGRPDPGAFYANPATKLSLAKNSFNVILTFLSDIIIVFRTYVIWNGNWFVIVLPVCLMIVNLTLGVFTLIALGSAKTGDDLILATVTVRFKYYLIVTFCLNVICASSICWKIWRVHSRVSRIIPSSSGHVMEVIMQSAGIYCAHLFALIVTNAVGTNAFFILLDPLPPMAAIIFSMMLVRAQDRRTPLLSDRDVDSRLPPTADLRFWKSRSMRTPVSIGVNIDLERIVHRDQGTVQDAPPLRQDGSSEQDKPRSIS
ncbi:hypothetical protein L226DRAFT_612450 [Lentinus tigrinus ALCF2SS1-7]|uniref:uncharacterized protein n=1 Tax=Lentinus tigrinus ALCF2SS1-7 TaxID=1328758 RepID=UPI001165E5FD|nr:hypothetical protein L226DRAFT_612450 [Lentinus tigrinus ALCF2SS1-7]